jgi:hypothetical protein
MVLKDKEIFIIKGLEGLLVKIMLLKKVLYI